MKWFKVLHSSLLPGHGSIKSMHVNGKPVCIINNDGQFFITQAYCPHAGAHLEGGWCKNGLLICPVHRYAYDLQTGKGAEGQGDYIQMYPTELRADGLYVGFKEHWWTKLWN